MRALLLLPLISMLHACSGYVVAFEQSPCADVNLSEPGDPEIWFSEDGNDLLILRSHAFVPSNALFTPLVEIQESAVFGRVRFEVAERWEDPATSTEVSCISPTLRVVDGAGDAFSVEWYEEELAGTPVAVGAN
jgi:hypothetical protein